MINKFNAYESARHDTKSQAIKYAEKGGMMGNHRGEIVELPVCPICKQTYTERPALSRRDNKTEICPNCGMLEALEDMHNATKPHGKKEVKDAI